MELPNTVPFGKVTLPVLLLILIFWSAAFAFPDPAEAALKTPADRFVRTANYYLKAGTDIRPEHYPQLAEYDLIILPAEAQVYNREMFGEVRKINPNVIFLAYVPSKSWNYSWVDSLHRQLEAGIRDDWWLLDPQGNRISVWPGTAVLSGASGWNQYLPQFVRDRIWSTGLWDGIFYDEFSATISWANGGNIDLHRDGRADDRHLMDTAWSRGMVNILKSTREYLGAEAVIVINGDSSAELQPYVNGRMFESFPTPWEGSGTWRDSMANYFRLERMVGYPNAMIINGNTGNSGQNADWRRVRFTLCSTLLGDGFFSFDFGESDHGQMWRYDEMGADLGRPIGPAVNLTGNNDTAYPGVWRRDFENGISLVNSTGVSRNVDLGVEMERIRGTQDPQTNDGRIVSSVTVHPQDGLILLKPIDRLIGTGFPNGSYARIFDRLGNRVRNGFFSYVRPQAGGAQILIDDLDGDGREDTVVGNGGEIRIVMGNGGETRFRPYGDAYRSGISLAAADMDRDGKMEVVTGTGPGNAPLVRVFRLDGSPVGNGFHAYSQDFRGGINVTAGDLYGNGWPVIIAGAGPGGGPHVRVFNLYGKPLYGFMAYDPAFRGGVNVAIGDFDGDGTREIATGSGPGGGPHVRVFSRYGRLLNPGFMAADPNSRNGVVVAASDTNRDGTDEIIALSTDVFSISSR
ncbi:VCBS repeat-containing protein [Candidatus Uhrbacteria bacterium]|nr:VCBS repeat-containing protein [Candidatus Uhrbacteria bacterium]